MRIAIIGGGSIGQRHAANARELGHDVEVYDRDSRRGSDIWPVPFVADAVMICTPAESHASVAEAIKRLGYRGALFVEKPIDVVSDSLVFKTWPHRVTMVGYNWRFHPHLTFLEYVAPTAMRCTCHTDMSTWPGAAYADPLLECSHEIDLAMSRLGPVTDVGVLPIDRGVGLRLQHERGASHVVLRWAAKPWRRFSVELADGTFVDIEPNVSADAAALCESYRTELRHFLDCAQHGLPTAIPFEQGLQVVQLCERVKELATAC